MDSPGRRWMEPCREHRLPLYSRSPMRELTPIYSAAMPSRLRTTLVTFLALTLAIGVIVTIASA